MKCWNTSYSDNTLDLFGERFFASIKLRSWSCSLTRPIWRGLFLFTYLFGIANPCAKHFTGFSTSHP